jgi:hypothetical protein
MAVEVLLWCIAVLLATAPAGVVGARRTTMTFFVYASLVVSTIALATVAWALVTDAGLAQTLLADGLMAGRISGSTRWPRVSRGRQSGRRNGKPLRLGYGRHEPGPAACFLLPAFSPV